MLRVLCASGRNPWTNKERRLEKERREEDVPSPSGKQMMARHRLFSSCFTRLSLLGLLLVLLQVNAESKRVDIFRQSGSDMAQLRPGSKLSLMFNALPRNSIYRWNEMKDEEGMNIIPFVIQGAFSEGERLVIDGAMRKLAENACIRFRPRQNETDYIEIHNQRHQGCYTTVGRAGGKTILMLEANEQATCLEHDIVIHELLHVVGLWHEHMRFDRDKHIRVHYENIEPAYHSQFEKIPPRESSTFDVPYDYHSVMHYAKDAFARPGKISMETLDPQFQEEIGNVKTAAPSDYRKVCILYQCTECMGKPFSETTEIPTVKPTTTEKTTISTTVKPSEECVDSFKRFCRMITSLNRQKMCSMFGGLVADWCCASCAAIDERRRMFSMWSKFRSQPKFLS